MLTGGFKVNLQVSFSFMLLADVSYYWWCNISMIISWKNYAFILGVWFRADSFVCAGSVRSEGTRAMSEMQKDISHWEHLHVHFKLWKFQVKMILSFPPPPLCHSTWDCAFLFLFWPLLTWYPGLIHSRRFVALCKIDICPSSCV